MAIYRVQHNKNYTVINNTICKDNRISWKAKGIWLYAFSRPDDWQFHINDLVKQSTDGESSVTSGLKELETFGYLMRDQDRGENGQFSDANWTFYETPQTELKKCLPKGDFPSTVIPSPDNPPILSTEDNQERNHHQSKDDDDLIFNEFQKEELNNYKPEQIEEATYRTDANCLSRDNRARVKYFFTTIRNLREDPIKPKTTPFNELSSHFKNGELYNQAECNMNEDTISFTRGMRYEFIDFKYFSWDKFQKLCENFGIEFKR